MATASQITEEESETLNCPVCVTKFDKPRILPCLHTICEKCLRVNIESLAQNDAQFTCPICKTPIAPSDANIDVDNWIGEFIPDKTTKILTNTAKSPDNKDDRCGPCKLEGENTTAEIWCIECQEKLCGPCVKYHKRYKMHHLTVPVDEMENKRLNISMNFDRSCARHHGKPLQLFCMDHRELCCVLCFTSNHRECNNIRDIDDVVKEQAKDLAYNKIIQDLLQMKTEMNKVIADINDNVVQLAQEKEKIINDVDTTVDGIIAKLNELRKSFRDDAGHLHEDGKRSLLKYEKVIQGFLTNIDNSCRILVNVRDHGSARQKFVIFETIRSQISSHHQQVKTHLKDDAKVHLSLKQNQILQDMEKFLNSPGVVEVTLKTNTDMKNSLNIIDDNIEKLNSHTQLGTSMCAAQVEESDMMTSSVTLVKTVTRQNLGKGTNIKGGAFFRDGRLVMADYNNSRLLQLDDNYNIVREHKMDSRPRDVAVGKNQNEIYILVCSGTNDINRFFLFFSDNFYIYRCTLDTRLTITQRNKAPRYTWGIAVSGDTIIAGTAFAVLLLSQDGSTIKSIPTSWYYNRYVAVSHTPLSFYHGDVHSVVSRTFDGKELLRYNNNKLKNVTGICVHNNSMYVCGNDSHNVHQISNDGRRSRILLDKLHSILQPWTVLVNQQKNELIVTSYSEDTVIEVYRLN